MEYYISQIIQGIATGSIYGLLGLAMAFIYRSNRYFNFAQGEMATGVAFAAVVMVWWGKPVLALPFAIAFAFVFGIVLKITILDRLREKNEFAAIITLIGLYAVINSVISFLFGFDPYTFPTIFPKGSIEIQGIFVSYESVAHLLVTFFISLALFLFFKFSLVGFAFQAIAEDPMAAKLKGVRVGLLASISWGISCVIGGISGMLIAHSVYLHPNTMGTVLLYSWAAAVMGGLQTSFGALAGGMLVGVIENLSGTVSWIGTGSRTVAVFVVLLFFLLFRPRGLFGRNAPRRI